MSNEIIKVLDELAQRFGIAIDWTSENITPHLMDMYNRIIAYNIVVLALWIVIAAGMLYSFYRVFKVQRKEAETTKNDNWLYAVSGRDEYLELELNWDELVFAFIVVSSIVCITCSISIIANIFSVVKWVLLPELQAINYITNLVG